LEAWDLAKGGLLGKGLKSEHASLWVPMQASKWRAKGCVPTANASKFGWEVGHWMLSTAACSDLGSGSAVAYVEALA
jgi:hypothetical protein